MSEKESKTGEGHDVAIWSGNFPIDVHNGSGTLEQPIPAYVLAGKYDVYAHIVSPEEGSWHIVITKDGGSIWEGTTKYGDQVVIPKAPVVFGAPNLYKIEVSWSEKSDITLVIHADV